ncbi:hypothetical protein EF888_17070 [Silicimonas algicola]|uniref:hypothetical protein n=1 Tax=Silicimonas algicola TaxID=1826607 RepID=UPI000F8575D0|nr:hypothetical protein [Silicimonas algicola]AZQ68689.1 hypothetical protein EF888_17070 [Silicimonas algicola]
MTGDGRHKGDDVPRSLTRIRRLHDRLIDEGSKSRRETWSLVEADGKRKVLFEAHESGKPNASQPIEQRLMTVREALRGPRKIARRIWLSLED